MKTFEHMWEFIGMLQDGTEECWAQDFSEYLEDFHKYVQEKVAWGVDDKVGAESVVRAGDLLHVESLW